MPQPPTHQVFDIMERQGGGFVSALAKAWRRADLENSAKLMSVFKNYYDEYASRITGWESVETSTEEFRPTHGSDAGFPHGE